MQLADVNPADVTSTGEGRAVSRRVAVITAIAVAGVFVALRTLPLIGTHISGGIDTLGYEGIATLPPLSHDFLAGAWPPGYPLYLKVVRHGWTAAVVGQAVLAAIAWLFLAVMTARASRHRVIRIAAPIVVLALGASFSVIQWDAVVSSDSIALSLGVALLATTLLLCERWTIARVVLFAAIALLAALDRDSNGLFFGVAAVVLAIVVLCRLAGRRWLVVAAALLVAATLSTLSSNGGHRWEAPLRDVITIRLLDSSRQTRQLADHGMPLTAAEIRTARGRCVAPTPVPACATISDPRFYEWIHVHGRAAYLQLLLREPGTALVEPVRHLDQSLGTRVHVEDRNGVGTLERAPISHALDTTVFIFDPVVVAIGALVVLVGSAVLLARRRPGAYKLAALLIVLAYLHLVVVWLGDALEVTRHSVVASVQLRLGVWLGALWLADAVLRPTEPTPESLDRRGS